MLPENATDGNEGQQPLRLSRERVFRETGKDRRCGRTGKTGRGAYRMRQAGKGYTEFPQAALLLRGLQDIHAAVLRDRQLVPHHCQTHGRENIGGNTTGTGDDGIPSGKPEVHRQKKVDNGRRVGMTNLKDNKCITQNIIDYETDCL